MAKTTLYRVLEGYLPTNIEGEIGDAGLPMVVEEYLEDGWKLHGGPFLVDSHNTADRHLCGQAVCKQVND